MWENRYLIANKACFSLSSSLYFYSSCEIRKLDIVNFFFLKNESISIVSDTADKTWQIKPFPNAMTK